MIGGPDPLTRQLTGYHPRGEREAADLARLHALTRTVDDPWLRTHPLHVTASALIVHPGSGRVLLRWHRRQQAWLQVGGHGDPGERNPIEVALREGGEESGLPDLAPWPGAGLVHAVIVPVRASRTEPAHEHADLRFVLTTQYPDLARPERPEAPLRWLDLPAAERTCTEPNVRETLSRLRALLTTGPPAPAG